jgi:hypothetical protein
MKRMLDDRRTFDPKAIVAPLTHQTFRHQFTVS